MHSLADNRRQYSAAFLNKWLLTEAFRRRVGTIMIDHHHLQAVGSQTSPKTQPVVAFSTMNSRGKTGVDVSCDLVIRYLMVG